VGSERSTSGRPRSDRSPAAWRPAGDHRGGSAPRGRDRTVDERRGRDRGGGLPDPDGNCAIGFNRASAGFDRALVSGRRGRDRLVREETDRRIRDGQEPVEAQFWRRAVMALRREVHRCGGRCGWKLAYRKPIKAARPEHRRSRATLVASLLQRCDHQGIAGCLVQYGHALGRETDGSQHSRDPKGGQ